jgi:hypothetical protein
VLKKYEKNTRTFSLVYYGTPVSQDKTNNDESHRHRRRFRRGLSRQNRW